MTIEIRRPRPVAPDTRRLLAACLLVVLASPARAASWEATRRTVIDPLNTELHRHLPLVPQEPGLAGGPGPLRDRHRRRRRLGPQAPRARRDRGGELALGRPRRAGVHPRALWPAARALPYDRAGRAPHRPRRLARPRRGRLARNGAARGPWDDPRRRPRFPRAAGGRARRAAGRTLADHPRGRDRAHARGARAPRFAFATESAGIANVHRNDGSPIFRLFGGGPDNPIGHSSGAAVADVDRERRR